MKFKILAGITFLLLSYALYQGMVVAPREATMGDIQRIFYYHVPSAWTSFLCFFANFIASIIYLARRNLKADAFAVSTAEVGVVFCTVVLVTGPLWARPVWGIWWTWDARLTTTLVLWLIYVSYLMLRRYSTGQATPTLAAALAIFGFLDVPIVYMSIRWWRTQHPQPVIAGGQGSGLDPHMWAAVLWNWAAFMAFAALLIWVRYRLEITRQQLDEAHALKAVGQAEGSFTR
ncbi:MAG: cytochrome c biogenesis protein [Terriglobales bacterium]